LKNISFTLNKGGHLAIVGVNGAGKTTLVKLLAGLLEPTEGRIYLSDKDIHNSISAINHDFGHYFLSVADNVYISDSNKPFDEESISQCLNWAGLEDYAGKPQNIMLGKDFGGRELSGGQWWRIAMARINIATAP
jgi:ATP-binding cassette subfamily B protein